MREAQGATFEAAALLGHAIDAEDAAVLNLAGEVDQLRIDLDALAVHHRPPVDERLPLVLMVSSSPRRRDAETLDGQVIAEGERVYIFLTFDAPPPTEVRFFLDGVLGRTERVAPFDMGGTNGDGEAGAVIFARAGSYDVSAEVDRDGDTEIVTARVLVPLPAVEPPLPSLDEYGRREGPRVIDARAEGYYDESRTAWLPQAEANGDMRGERLAVSLLPRWPGSTPLAAGTRLANATIYNDSGRQVAIWHRENAGRAQLVDIDFADEFLLQTQPQQNGLIDAHGAGGGRHYINVRIPGAADHGIEMTGGNGRIAGCDVKAHRVALAANMHPGDICEDSRFEMTGPQNEWHCGSHKAGGDATGGIVRRTEFYGGPVWDDLGSRKKYIDVLVQDSPTWAFHGEVLQTFREDAGQLEYLHCSTVHCGGFAPPANGGHWLFRQEMARISGNRGNPSWIQMAHWTLHMARMRIERAHSIVDINEEVFLTEWDDSRRDDYADSRGYNMTSEGSALIDSLVELSHDPSRPILGFFAKMNRPDHVSWDGVHVTAPESLRSEELVVIPRVGGGWRWLTIEAFFATEYATNCEVQYA